MAAANGFTDASPDAAYGDANWGQITAYADAQQFTAPGSGTLELSEIGCYAHSGSVEQTLRFAVFTDDAANGCPEAIVENSEATVTFNSGTIAQRSATYGGTKPQITGGTIYWIAAICSGTRYTRYYATGGDAIEKSGISYPTWPTASEWQSSPSANTNDLSLYAVYSEASDTPTGEMALEGQTPVVLVPHILAPGVGAVSLAAPDRFMADLYCGDERITSREITPTSTFASTLLELTDAERALITDWNDLELALTANGRQVYVSWAGVETPGLGVSPDAGALAVTGVAPLPDLYGQEASVAGSMDFAGNAPSLQWDRAFFPATVSLALDALIPAADSTVEVAKNVDADELALAGLVPVVLRDYSVSPDLAAMVMEGLAISPSTSHTMYPGLCALVFSGEAPLPPARAMRWSGEALDVAGVAPGTFTVAGVTGGQLEYFS